MLFLCVIAHSECKISPHVLKTPLKTPHSLKEDAVRGEGYHILSDEPFPASTLISSTDVIRETLTLIFGLIPNMIKLKDNATLISFNTS